MMCRNPLLPPGMALLCAVLCSVVSAEEKARPSSVEASFCQAALNFLRTKSTDVETRRAAASVVKALADEPRAPALVELLKNTDEEPNVRVSLTQALGRLKHKQAVPLFSELVTDPAQHRSLREAGLEGLVALGDTGAIPQLKAALTSPKREERIFAAHCLAALGDTSGAAIPVLVEALGQTSPRDSETLSRVSAAMGKLRDPAAIPELIALMEKMAPNLRRHVHRALVRIALCDHGLNPENWATWWGESASSFRVVMPNKDSAPLLVAKLSGSRNVRPVASAMLRQLGEAAIPALAAGLHTADTNHDEIVALLAPLGQPAIPALIDILGSGSRSLRQRTRAAALANVNEWRPFLIQSATDTKEPARLRAECISILGEAKDGGAAKALTELLEDEEIEVRCSSLEALAKMGGKEVVGHVVRSLNSPDPSLKKLAQALLPSVAGADVPLIAAALKNTEMGVEPRETIVRALAGVDVELATKLLCECLTDDERSIRVAAARALGERGDKAAIPAVRAAITGRDVTLLCALVESLGELEDAESIPRLGELARSQAVQLANSAVAALGRIPDPAATQSLIKTLDTFNDDVRMSVVKALRAKRDADAVNALATTLKSDPVDRIRDAAALALAERKQPSAIPYLIDRLEKADRRSRGTFLQALRRMTGQTELSAPEEWRDWLEKNPRSAEK